MLPLAPPPRLLNCYTRKPIPPAQPYKLPLANGTYWRLLPVTSVALVAGYFFFLDRLHHGTKRNFMFPY